MKLYMVLALIGVLLAVGSMFLAHVTWLLSAAVILIGIALLIPD